MAQKMKGARLVAHLLKAHGVTHVFFMDAVLRRALAEMEDFGITRILGHSEKAVAYMADGYARVSGRPGICMAQSVGAANLASRHAGPLPRPLTGDRADRTPRCALTVSQLVPGSRSRVALCGGDEVSRPHRRARSRFRMLFRAAFREATTGTPRPCISMSPALRAMR